jgi:hypothetical protein
MNMSRRNLLAAGGNSAIISMVSAAYFSLTRSAATEALLDRRTTSDTLGATARQAMIDIFRKKDPTAVIDTLPNRSYNMIRTSLTVLPE